MDIFDFPFWICYNCRCISDLDNLIGDQPTLPLVLSG